MAAQLTLTKARADRGDRLWIARATSSLPVPVSPVISTVESVGATLDTCDNTARRGGEVHHGSDVLGSAGWFLVEGMGHNMQMLHGAVRHDDSVLEIPVLGLARGP